MDSNFDWLNLSAEQAARRLLGCELVRQLNGQVLRVRIVETEAYDQADPASHAYIGQTNRNRAMFTSAGHLYVYFIYGMHYSCNVVCGPAGFGAGALIRAVEPIEGTAVMQNNRGGKTGKLITNGPGKVCQALAIDTSLSGHYLDQPPVQLVRCPPLDDSLVGISPRIGLSKATEIHHRFYIIGNNFVSG